ncbi:hypothetical protein ALC57_04014, partial [Trachymyrmex cornetzi]
VRWKEKKYISDSTYRGLLCNDGILPMAYALPKILVYKQDCPFRIIVSSINSPLYSLAVFLHNIIIKTIPKADSHIDNSFKLVKELDDRRLSDEFQLMSLDVVTIFLRGIHKLSDRWEKCIASDKQYFE